MLFEIITYFLSTIQTKYYGINLHTFSAPKPITYQLIAALSPVLGHNPLLVLFPQYIVQTLNIYHPNVNKNQISLLLVLVCGYQSVDRGDICWGQSDAVASDKRIIISTRRGKTVVVGFIIVDGFPRFFNRSLLLAVSFHCICRKSENLGNSQVVEHL